MPDTSTDTASRVVILLHGFAAHWLLMTRLQKHVERAGHRTLNWGYNSWFQSIEHHAEQLQRQLATLDADENVKTIDFVTHSMGCIVTRAALNKFMPNKTGRWVMLAPPNQGSLVANSVPRFIKRVMKPIDELQAKQDSYVNQLPVPQDIEIAIVQATADYIVSAPLTQIPEENARIEFSGLHSQLLFRKDVWRQSLHFLYHGRFSENQDRSNSESTP